MADSPTTNQPATQTPSATINPETPPAAASQPTVDAQAPAAEPPPNKPSSKRILFIIGGVLLVGLSALFAYFLSVSTQTKPSISNTTETNNVKSTVVPTKDTSKTDINNPQAFSKVFVYGSWSGQTSLIKAVELATNTTTLLASLPSSIKKVSVLSAQKLLYIDQTDKRDHGKQLVIYNIKSKSPQISIPATPGFGIDDYILSPDKNYVAIWEVAFTPNTEILQGGKSRVYAVDLSRPTVKKLLYDETATPSTPVHYPRAILNNGRVFADKFLPNDPKGGAGWAYGLSVVDFDGTNRQDLSQMASGTYGTQPSLSADGKYLVFSGYDGSRGNGNALNGGYRQAILTPNTVELFNTETFSRTELPNIDNKNIYSSSEWDTSSGKIILTVVSEDKSTTGVYSYNLSTRSLERITVPSTSTITYGFLTQVTDNTTLIGSQDTNASNLGNLGDAYAFPFTQVALVDNASSKVSFVRLEDTFAQYITILPGNYFSSVLGMQAQAQTIPKPTFVDLFSSQNTKKDNQQLYTFMIKTDLLTVRQKQQSSTSVPSTDKPIACEDLAVQQCAAQGITQASGEDAFKECVSVNKDQNKTQKSSGLCSDSPLYLYGPAGTNVKVQIQTAVSNAIPTYSNGYDITLGENGLMDINGKNYRSIAYDYKPNARITKPTYGAIIERNAVEEVLREYARKLGLNAEETADLVSAGKQKARGPYVFVSFFDQTTSQQILPLTFNPEPDNYLNVVFYLKNLADKPNFTPVPPVFPEPVRRTGFTAIEVSEIVE